MCPAGWTPSPTTSTRPSASTPDCSTGTFTDAIPAEAPGHYLIATLGRRGRRRDRVARLRRRGRHVAHLHRGRRRGQHRQGGRSGGWQRHPRSGRRRAGRAAGRLRRSARRRVPAVAGAQATRCPTRQRPGGMELQRPADDRSARGRDVLLTVVRLGDRRRRVRDRSSAGRVTATTSPRPWTPTSGSGNRTSRTPPGFEDAVAWMGIIPEGQPEHLAR